MWHFVVLVVLGVHTLAAGGQTLTQALDVLYPPATNYKTSPYVCHANPGQITDYIGHGKPSVGGPHL